MSKWRLAARQAIQGAIASAPPGAFPYELKKAIDAAYPFGQRENHPYKIWLSERRAYFCDLGIHTQQQPKKKNRGKGDRTSPGQLKLF